MEVLYPKQSVAVTLDGVGEQFKCYVRSIGGAVTSLGQLGGIAPVLHERLSPGALGYLCWRASDGGRMSVRGVVTEAADGGSGFAFVALEALDVLERRSQPRLPLAAVTQMRELDMHGVVAGSVIESVTLNLSIGGALIERREGLEPGAHFGLVLHFDEFPAPVACEARIVRNDGVHVGLRFTAIDERNRARLAVLLAHHRRQAA